MELTIEKIQGEDYTVIWYMEKTNNHIRLPLKNGGYVFYGYDCGDVTNDHIATALPVLPKYPKLEDSKLLARYWSEGLFPWESGKIGGQRTIEYCLDEQGNHVEVAIKEGK